MATIAVRPAALYARAGRVSDSADAIGPAYRALTAVVCAEPAAGDPGLAAALAEFAEAWARVLPLISDGVRLHGTGLRAAADRYIEDERRASRA